MRVFKPFSADEEMSAIGSRFLDRTLPKAEWTHAAHFATTLWLLSCRKDLSLAREMPHLIRAYNESIGGRNSDTEGYHETITQASIRAARDFLASHPNGPLFVTCNALMGSRLGEPDWLMQYWSRPLLFSVEARKSWVEPDIKPLPF